MEYLKVTAPGGEHWRREAVKLYDAVFGRAEAELAEAQLSGGEQGQNLDVLFVAAEQEQLCGTCHLTVPRRASQIGALGGVCTASAARGRGVARTLCTAAVREFDALGGKALFLGTGNPAAAAIYQSLGFSFLPGSNVMARCREKQLFHFYREQYDLGLPCPQVCRLDPAFRIPLIPLVLYRGDTLLLDSNVGLLSTRTFTQSYCMSLYPKYQAMAEAGGVCYGAFRENGMLCAIATLLETDGGFRADGFCYPGYEDALTQALRRCGAERPGVYALLADCDRRKAEAFSQLGFVRAGSGAYEEELIRIPCTLWRR